MERFIVSKNGEMHHHKHGQWVLASDAWAHVGKCCENVLLVERKRVWDEIIDRIDCGGHDDHPVDELRRLRDDLFPDGEPKELNPPRRGTAGDVKMERIREFITRIRCGKLAFVMAYKNPRIMQQGFIDLMSALFGFLIMSEEAPTPMLTKWGIAAPNNEGHILLNLWAAKPGANPISRIEELINDRDKAIAAAVIAEQKRVWAVLDAWAKENQTLFDKHPDSDGFYWKFRALADARTILFPDGEPTAEESSADQTNPPAWERREM